MKTNLLHHLHSIPHCEAWLDCEKLTLGWSSDEKYIITAADGQKLLLRTAEESLYEQKKQEFSFLEQLSRMDVNASRPVDFGRFDGGVYTLYTYLDGESMEDRLPHLSESRQYLLGVEAGEILARIHTLPAPENSPDWEEYMNRKFDRKIKGAQQCPLSVPGGERMIDFINARRHLLRNRPKSMHHGDYHCGNLLLTPEGHVGVIDFNRFDCGDPWEEFNRIVWCAQTSAAFASGRINGYFAAKKFSDIPSDFFPLLAAYIFSNQLSSLPWAIPFGEKQINVMLRQANMVLDWYDGCTRAVPAWYIPPEDAEALLADG